MGERDHYLHGADDVRSAANTMSHAADNMRSAANTMSDAIDRQRIFLDEWMMRFERAVETMKDKA